ncbi:MAG: TonB-dependent receptor [Bacteroidota bacterium]
MNPLILSTILLLMSMSVAGLAQPIALSESHAFPYQERQSLKSKLSELEKKYEIHFSYANEVVDNRFVNYQKSESSNLKKELTEVLDPLGLVYSEVESGFFYIFPKQSSFKKVQPLEKNKAQSISSSSLIPKIRLQMARPLNSKRAIVEKTISGTVTDSETNEPLPGVNILAKGTTQGTVSDVEGQYNITVADEVTALIFSSIGYISEEISINDRSTIDVVLVPDIASLNEVVVIGYGTKERRDLTTAISSIETEEITQTVALSPELAMQGRMTGVQVSGNNGNPFTRPTVRIRGQNTWRASDPLYVIDGVPIREPTAGTVSLDNARFEDIRGPLNIMTLIDPNDIASISVLKDASAAAIYGVAAGNGVVLVTTKSGKRNEGIKVQVGARAGIRRQNRRYDVMNSEEFARYQRLVYESDPTFDLPPDHAPLIFPDSTGYLGGGPTYDWQDAVTNNEASFQDYSLILSGGSTDTDYKVGFNYASNDGVSIGTNLERISGSFNVNFDITDWLRTGVNARVATVDGRNRQFNATNQILGAATTNPWQPIFGDGPGGFAQTIVGIDDNGNWNDTRLWGSGTRANALADDFFNTTTFQSIRGLGNAYLQVEPLEGLTLTGRLYLDQSSNKRFLWRDADAQVFSITGEDPRSLGNGFSQGRYNYRNNLSTNLMRELSLNYQKSFGKHNLDLLLTVQDQRWEGEYLGVETEQTSSSDPDLRFIPATQDEYTTVESEAIVREALVGQFIRAGYDYDNTYYLDVTVRRDGSTRFAPENRFGVFPAFSAAYRITNEPFMSGVTGWLNDLKIRGGWGQLGNYDVAQLAYLSPVEEKPTYSFGGSDGNGNVSTGAAVFTIPNPDLQWERTTTTNIGFDAYLLNNNLGISFDYYNKRTEDILQTVPLPSSVGVSLQPSGNIGEVVNRGIEIAANYQFSVGPVNLDIGANITTVHNEVTKLQDGIPVYGGGLTLEEGQPINFIRGYQLGGIFTDQGQVDDFLASTEDENYRSAEVAPGDLYFVDVAGAPAEEGTFISPEPDGVINFFDQTFLGNTLPGYFYGFNLGVNMKGFSLSMQFTGVGDVSRYNLERRELITTGFYGDNRLREVFNAWSESNPNSTIPRIIANDPAQNNRFSSRFIESGAYLRLNYLELGYTLPNPQKLGMSRARIYVGGSNIFTAMEYTGLDPESYDSPTPITLLTGLNITF